MSFRFEFVVETPHLAIASRFALLFSFICITTPILSVLVGFAVQRCSSRFIFVMMSFHLTWLSSMLPKSPKRWATYMRSRSITCHYGPAMSSCRTIVLFSPTTAWCHWVNAIDTMMKSPLSLHAVGWVTWRLKCYVGWIHEMNRPCFSIHRRRTFMRSGERNLGNEDLTWKMNLLLGPSGTNCCFANSPLLNNRLSTLSGERAIHWNNHWAVCISARMLK